MKITTYTNPRQVILVTSRYKSKDNIFALDWHTPLSFEPKIYAISVSPLRFSHYLISKSKVFVVNFMDRKYEKQMWFCGSNSGKHIDKFKETGLEKQESEKINCPCIKQALAFFECKVTKQIKAGDHTLFIAKVVKESFKEHNKRLFHIHTDNFTTTLA